MARQKSNKEVMDDLNGNNEAPKGRWVKTASGGEEWIPEGEMSAAEWYQEQKRIDGIERYLRS